MKIWIIEKLIKRKTPWFSTKESLGNLREVFLTGEPNTKKKNSYQTSVHHAFSHRPTFGGRKKDAFSAIFFSLSAHFDPTLVQHFIQKPHMIFFACKWWLDQKKSHFREKDFGLSLRQDPLEAILVMFGRRALIFFYLKALEKNEKMTPPLCACAVVIILETQKCRKRAPRSVEFNFFINCDRQKRFSQNERRRIALQNCASDFLIFAWGFSYDLSKFSDDFTQFFRLWKTITRSLDKN